MKDNLSDPIYRIVNFLYEDAVHETFIFPEDSNETITFAAGDVINIFGAWAEIVDNNGIKLSSKFLLNSHISSINMEKASIKDKIYILEISYGDSKIVVIRCRFLSGDTIKLNHIFQGRIRALEIPSGEKVYYKMKCETADATIIIHMRYHSHE